MLRGPLPPVRVAFSLGLATGRVVSPAILFVRLGFAYYFVPHPSEHCGHKQQAETTSDTSTLAEQTQRSSAQRPAARRSAYTGQALSFKASKWRIRPIHNTVVMRFALHALHADGTPH